MKIFKKPVSVNKGESESLEKEINALVWERDSIKENIASLEKDYEIIKKDKQDEIRSLDDILWSKNQEYKALCKPLTEREKFLAERETNLQERLKEITDREQETLRTKLDYREKIENLQDLSDELGAKKIALSNKEKMISAKEQLLQERESSYLLQIEKFNIACATAYSEIDKRKKEVRLREFNVDSRSEMMDKREIELNNQERAIKDKVETLLRTEKYVSTINNSK